MSRLQLPAMTALWYGMAMTLVPACVSAETWPGWRGATGSGVSNELQLPVKWSGDENVAWRVELPGRGNASPAVTSDRIYLTLQAEDRSLSVLAIARRGGRILWNKKLGNGRLATDAPDSLYAHRHNPATPSPATDGDHVWAFFGTGQLACLDEKGKVKWQKDLVQEYGPYKIRFGMASSPRLWGNLLYVACMTKGNSYVVAFDKRTGKQVWKTDRNLPAEDDGPDAYSSPVILQTKDRSELVVAGSNHVNAYDLKTGRQRWISSGLKIDSPYGRVIASPAVSQDVVVVCSAKPPGSSTDRIIALRTGGSGDVTDTHRLWEYHPHNPDCATPVCYQGRVYMVRDDGVASCLDLKTGRPHWRRRLGGKTYRVAVVAGGGNVYFLSREGLCTVVRSGNEFDVLAENRLEDTFYATPAISDGMLYLHAYGRLYAVGSAKETSR